MDSFSFVERRPADLLIRSLSTGAATIATVRSVGHDIALHESRYATFLAPIEGRLGVEAGGTGLRCGAGGGLFLRPGARRTFVRAPDQGSFLAAVLTVPAARRPRDETRIAGLACETAAASPAVSAISGYLDYFLREYPQPGSPLQRPAALRACEALLLDLMAELERFDAEPATREPAASVERVRAAEAYMRANSDEPLTVEAVARAIGVGARALQKAFQVHRGASPRAVLTAFRMERARERLAVPDPAASVSDIALLSGFAHLGRFAVAYRARFGETPSQTLRRARG